MKDAAFLGGVPYSCPVFVRFAFEEDASDGGIKPKLFLRLGNGTVRKGRHGQRGRVVLMALSSCASRPSGCVKICIQDLQFRKKEQCRTVRPFRPERVIAGFQPFHFPPKVGTERGCSKSESLCLTYAVGEVNVSRFQQIDGQK